MSNQEQGTENTPAKKNVPLRVLIIVIILAVGVGIAVFLKKTAPHAKKVAPVKQAQLVNVQQVVREDARAQIYSYGTVRAARTVILKSQVLMSARVYLWQRLFCTLIRATINLRSLVNKRPLKRLRPH
ncbi:MAG: hypothetical protein JRG71_10565 [Deltaproteobacteria bacterium]|nr:hypothetical protein [Deltaproteobacteria bacterium]